MFTKCNENNHKWGESLVGCGWSALKLEVQAMGSRNFIFRANFWSELLPQSSSARTLLPVFGLWHPPSWGYGCLWNMNCNAVFRVSLSHCSSVLTQSDFQCSLCFSHVHLHAGNPYREALTPLLSVTALRSCFSLSSGLFSESSIVKKLSEGRRPSQTFSVFLLGL